MCYKILSQLITTACVSKDVYQELMWLNRVRYQNMIRYSVLIEALHSGYMTDGILQHVLH